ncbi:MAG: hypothetical protein SCALA702_13800 [Melioribacteraceae bacterium]|nr:MAG: hypothetical protein SCALA702_13800 [Melioribacteraceae bacterium]
MDKDKRKIVAIILIAAGIIVSGCTPASISSRYYNNDEEEETPAEEPVIFGNIAEPPVYRDNFIKKYETIIGEGVNIPGLAKMYIEIIRYIETPYLYGGESGAGMDCSGFTTVIFKNAFNMDLPRTAADQSKMDGKSFHSFNELISGDLVFFKIEDPRNADHVGIYLGNGFFAHSGFSTGVTISSFSTNYFSEHFYIAKRILSDL